MTLCWNWHVWLLLTYVTRERDRYYHSPVRTSHCFVMPAHPGRSALNKHLRSWYMPSLNIIQVGNLIRLLSNHVTVYKRNNGTTSAKLQYQYAIRFRCITSYASPLTLFSSSSLHLTFNYKTPRLGFLFECLATLLYAWPVMKTLKFNLFWGRGDE